MTNRELLELTLEVLPEYQDPAWAEGVDNIRCDVAWLRKQIADQVRLMKTEIKERAHG